MSWVDQAGMAAGAAAGLGWGGYLEHMACCISRTAGFRPQL